MPDTKCAVHNMTGDAIYLITSKNWRGVEGSYPNKLVDGQWARFDHKGSTNGSRAAVVYRIENIKGEKRDWMFAWDTPPKTCNCNSKTHAYTEVREQGHFTDEVWPSVEERLLASGQEGRDTGNGSSPCVITVNDSPADYVAAISVHK